MAKIVYAEDDLSIREIMRDFLKDAGYETISAENGLEALNIISQGGIDLLITDGDMPVMNGFELISRLSADKSTMPVIMLSGMNIYRMPPESLQILKDHPGRTFYHSKPPQIDKRTNQINQLLNTANIPKYGIYTNDEQFCTLGCEQLSKLTKKETVKEICLCEYDGPIARTAMSHPCETNQCMREIITKAEETPQTQFYIFALGQPERAQTRPLHNLTYLTNENIKPKFAEIVQRYTDTIPKQTKEQ